MVSATLVALRERLFIGPWRPWAITNGSGAGMLAAATRHRPATNTELKERVQEKTTVQ
jgi:hypothetical protein